MVPVCYQINAVFSLSTVIIAVSLPRDCLCPNQPVCLFFIPLGQHHLPAVLQWSWYDIQFQQSPRLSWSELLVGNVTQKSALSDTP